MQLPVGNISVPGQFIFIAVPKGETILANCGNIYNWAILQGHSDVAHYIPEHRFKLITVCLIVLAMIVGILIPSIELIIGLVGSTIGVAICIMFPASCYIKLGKKNSAEKLLAQVTKMNI